MNSGVRPGIFFDIFRYSLMVQRGGWWVDCDVVCLRPFEFNSEIVFGWQDATTINGAVMRLPQGHKAAHLLLSNSLHPTRWQKGDPWRRRARKARDAVTGYRSPATAKWGMTGPMALTVTARKLDLLDYALPTRAFYPVHWRDAEQLFATPRPTTLPSDSFAVHLWNEMLSAHTGEYAAESIVGGYLRQFGVD
ncbi:hypothetical protein AAFP30_16115 [Gordonia sp. CPCC 205515]|uniref:hypothetical protein n=1 Tax=Gordonia sp. CPCC 205515 TaxID=3140791 RepID=UPI003AF404F7